MHVSNDFGLYLAIYNIYNLEKNCEYLLILTLVFSWELGEIHLPSLLLLQSHLSLAHSGDQNLKKHINKV